MPADDSTQAEGRRHEPGAGPTTEEKGTQPAAPGAEQDGGAERTVAGAETERDTSGDGDKAAPAELKPERRRGWLRRNGKVIAFALVGAVLAVLVGGRVPAEVGPFDTTLMARSSLTGETVVKLSPLGTITLDTHDWPVKLELSVDELPLEEAERIARNPQLINTLGDDVDGEVRSALLRLGLWTALVAVVGGLLGALAARLSWRSAAIGTATAAVLVVGVGAGTAATFSAEAVAEPRYTGLLTVAPRAVGNVEAIIERFGEYREQLSDLVGNVATLYLTAEGLSTFQPTDDTVRLLHVSDIHLNPQAFDLIDQVSDQFEVDAVLDTGDITDWGSAPESNIIGEIGELDVPYVWVRGNHDSLGTQAAVAEQPNAVVLDDEATTVAGVRIWGIGDPRFTPNKDEITDGATEIRLAEEFAPEVVERLADAQPPPVDLAMVHDPRIAADLGGEVPVVLAGHRHDAQELRLDDNTVLLMEGSTGGAGLRALQDEVPEPLAATILYFDPGERRVVAYDRIALKGLGQAGVTIERHVIQEDVAEDDGDEQDGDEQDGSEQEADDTQEAAE